VVTLATTSQARQRPRRSRSACLLQAIERYVLEGFYDAVIELAPRCIDWRTRVTGCFTVVRDGAQGHAGPVHELQLRSRCIRTSSADGSQR
jgi:hypothetical protein